MSTLSEVIARIQADKQRAERDRAKGEEMIRRADTDLSRLDATLATLSNYGIADAAAENRRPATEAVLNSLDRSFAKERGKAAAVVTACLPRIDRDGSANIPDLLADLAGANFDLGDQPKARLASYLSRDKRVRHQHGTGWMRDQTVNNGPDTPSNEVSGPLSMSSNQGDA